MNTAAIRPENEENHLTDVTLLPFFSLIGLSFEDISTASILNALEPMSKEELFAVFEPAFRQNLALREAKEDTDHLVEKLKTSVNRSDLLDLARMLPTMISQLRARPNFEAEQSNSTRAENIMHQSTQVASTSKVLDQSRDVKMKESPGEPMVVDSSVPITADSATHNDGQRTDSETQMKQTNASMPPLEETVLNAIYILGTGEALVTTVREFEIPEAKFARAMAWNKRIAPLKEQIVYHFKVVKAADILAVFPKLADSGVVKPEVPPEGEGDEKELEEAAEMYDRTVAQAVYTLPTVWPPEENFSLIVNIEKDIDLSRKTGVQPYTFIDATDLVVLGMNNLQLIELKKGLQKYAFCLFEKRPGLAEIQRASM